MAKQELTERFHQLAGIKPLYEMEDEGMETTKEITKEDLLNESPEMWAALGSVMGMIGAAGVVGQIQAMAEDPVIAEKYPKLAKLFELLAKVAGSTRAGHV